MKEKMPQDDPSLQVEETHSESSRSPVGTPGSESTSPAEKPASTAAKTSAILLVVVAIPIGFVIGVIMIFMSGCWSFKGPAPACADVMGFAPLAMAGASLLFTLPNLSRVYDKGKPQKTYGKSSSSLATKIGLAIVILFLLLMSIFHSSYR